MKLGILGTGKIVREFLPWLAEHTPFTVQAICSTERSAELAQSLCGQYGVPQHTTNFLELLQWVDVVYIAVPNLQHVRYARVALEAGKHVIVEKPLAPTAAQTEELVNLARHKKVFLFEAITTQYLENYAKIRELLPRSTVFWDDQGRKFSKSLGNGIDPLEVIANYGADPLRLMLITGNAPGNDMRFYWERLDNCRNFCNKMWNASRFVMMNMEDGEEPKFLMLTSADKWILSKVNTLAKEVQESLSKYDLGLAAQKVYDFIWDEYCDWYIEMVKPRLYNKEDSTRAAALWTLKQVLINALKLMHPFMPFITEELFMHIQDEEETIMTSQWPVYKEEWNFKENEAEIDAIKEAVRNIRNIRAEMNVGPSKKVHVYVVSENEGVRYIFEHSKVFFKTLAHASEVTVQTDKAGIGEDAVSVVVQDATIYMPLAELVDFAKEIERLEKEKTKLEKEVDRVVKKLANQGFVAKAPAHVIEEEKAKEEKYKAMLAQVEERLAQLKK